MNFNKIDRKTAGVIWDKAIKALKEAFGDTNLVIDRGAGRFSNFEVICKISFSLPVDSADVKKIDDNMLKVGLAGRGYPALFGHDNKKVIIKEAKRKKYAFAFEDKPDKIYVSDFRGFKNRVA